MSEATPDREVRRRLGVMGTLVWDRIIPASPSAPTVQEWGGISYAIEALSVVLPEGWTIEPILKIGEDLAEEAREYLSQIPRVSITDRVFSVPGENYRVELRYLDETHRRERLTGSVPPWTWAELESRIGGIDALYLNFITGLEMESETATALAGGFPGPTYADLHSLFYGVAPAGERFLRDLPDWRRWLTSFDAVQVNEEEFRLLGRSEEDSWGLAREAIAEGLKLLAVTMGPEGAAFMASESFSADPFGRRGTPDSLPPATGARKGRVPLDSEPRSGDPTGCGDVWGATFFAGLLGGSPLEEAMAGANRIAALNVDHQGARGLRHHLLGAQR